LEESWRDIADRKKATEELKHLNGLLAGQAATDIARRDRCGNRPGSFFREPGMPLWYETVSFQR
jgi:hypothetical protein